VNRFNLELLRKTRSTIRGESELSSIASSVSRRTFLSLAGAGASFGKMSQDREAFSIARDGRKVHFLVNTQPRWTIDPDVFDGRPTIHLHRSEDRINLSLTDAFFPGTRLPAGFLATIERSDGRWNISIRTDAGLDVAADFLRWLRGQDAATGKWQGQGIAPFDGLAIRFEGNVDGALLPNWSIEAQGPSAAVVNGLSLPLRSDSWRLAMNEGEAIAGGSPAPRTLFTVRRESADWDINLDRTSDAGWRLSHDQDLFHLLRVESSSSPQGALHSVLLTQADESASTLRFHTGGGLLGDTGEPFHIPLRILASRSIWRRAPPSRRWWRTSAQKPSGRMLLASACN
jgi:hypothetical protein